MEAMKRHKPKASVRDKMDPASASDYERMAEACKLAVISRQDDILLSFPYFVKFTSKGFPKGILVDKTPTTNIYKVKAKKLLDWLHEHEYSDHSYRDVIEATHAIGLRLTLLGKDILGEQE